MNDSKNNQSISHHTNQLIRYYQVPFHSSKEDALDAVLNKIDEKQKKSQNLIQIPRKIVAGFSVAAVVVIAVIFWFFTATIQISSGNSGISTYRLPDNSRVVLHENSQINYPKYNWNRNVSLKGEAYFEVEKGGGFSVKTEHGKIEVLGTRFLVSDQRKKLSVKCFEGKVKTNFQKQSWILEPGTQFAGDNEKAVKEEFEQQQTFPEFAKFQAKYTNSNLLKIANDVEQFFNVEIEVLAGGGKNFSGNIETGSLQNTLEILCGSLQLNYRIINNNKVEIFK